jgi:hypothetical protein
VQASFANLPVCYNQLKKEFVFFTAAAHNASLARIMADELRFCRAPANASEVYMAQIYIKFAAQSATEFNYPTPVFYPIAWPLNRSCDGDSSSAFPISAALISLWYNNSGQVAGSCFNFRDLDVHGTTTIGDAWFYQNCNEVFLNIAGGASNLFGPLTTSSTGLTPEQRLAACKKFGPVKPALTEMPLRFPSTSALLRAAEISRLAFVNGEFDLHMALVPARKTRPMESPLSIFHAQVTAMI